MTVATFPPRRSRGRPRREDVEAIDAAVLEAGFAAFRSVGFDAAQMDAIATEAGITRTSLYRRFENKAALLSAVVASRAAGLAGIVRSVEGAGDALAQLRGLMRLYRRRVSDPDQIALQRLVISALPAQPSIGDALDALHDDIVGPVDGLIAAALAEGLLRPTPPVLLREMMFNLLVNDVMSLALMGLTVDVEDDAIFDLGWDVLMRGLAPA